MSNSSDPTLDHQYNTRVWAPNFAETIGRHGQLGEAVRARRNARLDLRWGEGPRQTLDFFATGRPSGSLALFIHGGYWQYRTSTKHSVSFLAPPFLERGIAFCAVSYELCPDVDMGGMVAQLRDAVRWVRSAPAELGFEASRLTVLGHSAGGHLAAMLALTDWAEHGEARALVDGACGVSGLYDLRPIARTYLNEPLRMDEAIALRNSPIAFARAGAPPMILAVGGNESPAFHQQAESFARVYPAPVFALEGKDHYNATEALLEPGPFQNAVMQLAS